MSTKQTQTKVNFDATPEDTILIHKICVRAAKLYYEKHKQYLDLIELEMDVIATHLNGLPLDLKKLSEFDDFNLAHDVIGIANHINRRTGSLTNYFLPRCSR